MIDSWTLILLHKRAASASCNSSSWFQHSGIDVSSIFTNTQWLCYIDLNADTHFRCTTLTFYLIVFKTSVTKTWLTFELRCMQIGINPSPPVSSSPPLQVWPSISDAWGQEHLVGPAAAEHPQQALLSDAEWISSAGKTPQPTGELRLTVIIFSGKF